MSEFLNQENRKQYIGAPENVHLDFPGWLRDIINHVSLGKIIRNYNIDWDAGNMDIQSYSGEMLKVIHELNDSKIRTLCEDSNCSGGF